MMDAVFLQQKILYIKLGVKKCFNICVGYFNFCTCVTKILCFLDHMSISFYIYVYYILDMLIIIFVSGGVGGVWVGGDGDVAYVWRFVFLWDRAWRPSVVANNNPIIVHIFLLGGIRLKVSKLYTQIDQVIKLNG